MPQTITVLCDQCGKDISSTTQQVQYRYTLNAETMPIADGGATSDAIDQPAFAATLYLCSVACVAAKATSLIPTGHKGDAPDGIHL